MENIEAIRFNLEAIKKDVAKFTEPGNFPNADDKLTRALKELERGTGVAFAVAANMVNVVGPLLSAVEALEARDRRVGRRDQQTTVGEHAELRDGGEQARRAVRGGR